MMRALKNFVQTARFVRRFGKQYAAIASFRRIDGWLTDAEAVHLYDIARNLPVRDVVIVEIGSWVGKSSVVLSHALAAKVNAKLFCIDPFNAGGEPGSEKLYAEKQSCLEVSLLEAFQRNVRVYGCAELVTPLQGCSYDFSTDWSKAIDFLFIDASHDYEDVLRDFIEWSPHLKVGGYIGFHDVRLNKRTLDVSGPCRVVRENILNSDCWDEKQLVRSLFTARRRC